MKRLMISSVGALALVGAQMTLVPTPASATHEIGHAILGGIIGGVIGGAISNAVQANQNHCHDGLGCHAHGGANAYHYHDAYGNVLYQQQVAPPRRVIVEEPQYDDGDWPPAHYDWCYAKYKSYDERSNSYQPYNAPRRLCRSPYGG